MNLVSLSQVRPEPWRNGGGRTQTLLTWPQAQSWQLRVSVARIDRDGPFSAFPGVQRHFVVLAGTGVELAWPARRVALSPRSEPLAFDGADAPDCRLLDGATDDLNLMAPASAGRAHLDRLAAGHAWRPAARWCGLYTHEAALLEVAGSEWPLPAGTLAWSDATDEPAWTLHAAHPGHAFALWLEAPAP